MLMDEEKKKGNERKLPGRVYGHGGSPFHGKVHLRFPSAPRRHNFISLSQIHLNVRLDTGSHLPPAFISRFALLCMRSNLLDRKGRGSNTSLVQGRGGQTLLCRLLFFLILNEPQTPLTNAREGFVLLCLNPSIKFLIKFSFHLYKKEKKHQESQKEKKRRGKKKKEKRKGRKDDPLSS